MSGEIEGYTIREAIDTYRGDFYRRLLAAHDSGKPFELCLAYCWADSRHQVVLDEAFPGIEVLVGFLLHRGPTDMRSALEAAFPGLAALDEPTDNPTGFDLLEEQP